jgi:hypothetical protein
MHFVVGEAVGEVVGGVIGDRQEVQEEGMVKIRHQKNHASIAPKLLVAWQEDKTFEMDLRTEVQIKSPCPR